jgi:hypothetical protein
MRRGRELRESKERSKTSNLNVHFIRLFPGRELHLTWLIEKYQPALCIHGHDHGPHDYYVGRTRILSNQAGYPMSGGRRENPEFNPGRVVEIG